MTEQEQPQEYGKCRIEKEIGRGAASIVYLAWHESLRIPVAVKVMNKSDNEGMTKRIMREANIAAQLSHPGIVRIYDCGETEDSYYLVLDFIDGDDCLRQIDEKGAYAWSRAVEIIRQVADGLRYAHERGMIHRDLKPQNIMIDASGKACLADLGLAKIISEKVSSETLAGDVLGTPFYMSPEQVKQPRDVDFRSDIYSLGATLYHMVFGVPPFEAPTAYEIMAKHLSEALVFPEEKKGNLPEPLCQLMMRAMAKDPADRYQSYEDLMADLDALLSGEHVADSDVAPAHEPAPDADMAAIRAGILEEAEKAPLPAPPHVDPSKLGATVENVQAKVAGVLALLAYVFLLACVHQLVLTRAGLGAAVALTVAMLLVMAGSSLSVLRRSSQGADGEAPNPVEEQLYRALEPLCERLAVPTPRLYISLRQRSDWYVYSFRGLKACIDVPGGWLSRANLTDEQTEALAAQGLGSLYSSDSGIRLLLAGPVELLRIGRWAGAGLRNRLSWLSPPLGRYLVDGAALTAMAGILAVLGLLARLFPWGAVMGLVSVALLLLVAWFERSSRHAADAFATKLTGSSDAVRSLVAVSGLEESEYNKPQQDPSPQAEAGESTAEPQQNEALLIADGIVSRYSETRYRPGLCARVRAFVSPVPCSAERISRLAGVAQTRLPAARTVAAAKRVLAGLARIPEERTVTIRELAAVESHEAGGAIAGVVAVALLMLLSFYEAPVYAGFLAVTVLFACGLGVLVAARASRGVISPACFGWRIVVGAVFFTCASMVAICLVGGRNLSFLASAMPLSVVPISLVAAISGALCVRLSRSGKTSTQPDAGEAEEGPAHGTDIPADQQEKTPQEQGKEEPS